MMRRLLMLLVGAAALSGCVTKPKTPDIAAPSATFVVERDLVGETVGRGVFKSRFSKDRAFTAFLDGSWDGEVLTLVEDFEFEDGEKDRKTWRLRKLADGTFSGTREDVVGEAKGYMDGDAFRLEYLVDLPRDGGGATRVGFYDVLVLTEDGAVYNKAHVGWRGLRVGGVELTITPAQ
ncbi:MAG: DUF3833 family protein [Pseudomonadota bacterium]